MTTITQRATQQETQITQVHRPFPPPRGSSNEEFDRVIGPPGKSRSIPSPRTAARRPMTATDRDPRPDIRPDSFLWTQVLVVAYGMDTRIHGLLHGLRCGGARLTKTTGGKIRLDYIAILAEHGGCWTKQELLDQWLIPSKAAITKVFTRAAAQ